MIITVESLGALYTDLYNADARTMPFVSALFEAAPPGEAFLLERCYASEPNTLHALFAQLCGARPKLGMAKAEYLSQQRLAQCLPHRLRAHGGVRSAYFTPSNVGLQPQLGFDELWSSVDEVRGTTTTGQATARKRAKVRIKWPRAWSRHSTRALLRLRDGGQYNWLGDHDYFALPKVRDYVAARGDEQRFFLQVVTASTHHPYTGLCPSATGGAAGLRWEGNGGTLARAPRSNRTAAMLRAYLREVRCVDEFVRQVHAILRRAGRLHDTSLVLTGDHGEGFALSHRDDLVHGGSVYDSQARVPFVAFGPIARGMPKRVPGVWSDTSIGPTLLEALGLRHRDCRGRMAASLQQQPVVAAGVSPGVSPGVLDIFGCSVLSSAPPTHALMSCAFDNACVGLVMEREPTAPAAPGKAPAAPGKASAAPGKRALWKVISRDAQLEAYALDQDRYEDVDRADELTDTERNRSHLAMRTWASALQTFWKNPWKNLSSA